MNNKKLVNVFIFFVVGASLLVPLLEKPFHHNFQIRGKSLKDIYKDDIFNARSIPFYPFSSYLMYSNSLVNPKIFYLDIRGLQEGKEIFLPIYKYFFPFWRRGLLESYEAHLSRGSTAEVFFRGVLKLYQSNKEKYGIKESGSIDWPAKVFPEIEGIRVYKVTWSWEKWVDYRKTVPSLGSHYDYLESPLRPEKRELHWEIRH